MAILQRNISQTSNIWRTRRVCSFHDARGGRCRSQPSIKAREDTTSRDPELSIYSTAKTGMRARIAKLIRRSDKSTRPLCRQRSALMSGCTPASRDIIVAVKTNGLRLQVAKIQLNVLFTNSYSHVHNDVFIMGIICAQPSRLCVMASHRTP